MPTQIDDLLAFWFGRAADANQIAGQQQALWWKATPAQDRLIAERYGDLRLQAVRGERDDWLATPHGRLALILLVDQFSRCLFRGKAAAFEHDPLARRWCREGLERHADQALRPIERVFFYLPLEHSESREDQAQSVLRFEQLVQRATPAERALFENFAGFARAHRDVVQRFGRFPHRNAALGRPSTEEERAFLLQPGSSF